MENTVVDIAWYILIVGYLVIYFIYKFYKSRQTPEQTPKANNDKPQASGDKKPSGGGGDKKASPPSAKK